MIVLQKGGYMQAWHQDAIFHKFLLQFSPNFDLQNYVKHDSCLRKTYTSNKVAFEVEIVFFSDFKCQHASILPANTL